MKLLKIENKTILFTLLTRKHIYFSLKVFTDRIVSVTKYFYSTPNGRVPNKRFVFVKMEQN